VPEFPGVLVQPVVLSQPSTVHGFESSQAGAAPPTQLPPAQVSFVVQALASSQDRALFVCTHPVVPLHESVVHTFASSHGSGDVPTHLPPEQEST
jgi:hypothetical protein